MKNNINWKIFSWHFHDYEYENLEQFSQKFRGNIFKNYKNSAYNIHEIIIPYRKIQITLTRNLEKINNLTLSERLEKMKNLQNDNFWSGVKWFWNTDFQDEIQNEYENFYKKFQDKNNDTFILETSNPKWFEFCEFFFLLHNKISKNPDFYKNFPFLDEIIQQENTENLPHYLIKVRS